MVDFGVLHFGAFPVWRVLLWRASRKMRRRRNAPKCYSAWARTTKRVFSLPVSGQMLIMFFGELIMSRIQNDVIAVWIL